MDSLSEWVFNTITDICIRPLLYTRLRCQKKMLILIKKISLYFYHNYYIKNLRKPYNGTEQNYTSILFHKLKLQHLHCIKRNILRSTVCSMCIMFAQ